MIKILTLSLSPFLIFAFASIAAAQKPVSSPAASPSPAVVKLERETKFDGNIEFPEVDGWERSEKYQYPTADLGYSVNYESPGTRMTVYVYKGGKKSITNELTGVIADEMKKAKSELQSAVDAGLYESAQAGKTETIMVGGTKGVVKTLYAPLKLRARGSDLHSAIYIFPYNNYFIKIRATHRNAEAAKNADVAMLLEALDLLFSK